MTHQDPKVPQRGSWNPRWVHGEWGRLPALLAVKPCTEDGTRQLGSFSQENLHPPLWGETHLSASLCWQNINLPAAPFWE